MPMATQDWKGVSRKFWLMSYRGTRFAFLTNVDVTAVITFLPADHFKSGSRRKRTRWHAKTRRAPPEDLIQRKLR